MDTSNLEKYIECPICLEFYEESGPQVPVMLSPCCHSVCEQCLIKLATDGCQACPVCSCELFISEDGYPENATNFYLIQMLNLVASCKKKHPPTPSPQSKQLSDIVNGNKSQKINTRSCASKAKKAAAAAAAANESNSSNNNDDHSFHLFFDEDDDEHQVLNSAGNLVRRGTNQKWYCGKKYGKPHKCPCSGCDGVCGPTDGCPCVSCMDFNSVARNNAGNQVWQAANGKWYCGRKFCEASSCECGYCDGFCGLEEGCNCKPCQEFGSKPRNDKGRIVFKIKTADGAAAFTWCCGARFDDKVQCSCGECDGMCGLKNRCLCTSCERFVAESRNGKGNLVEQHGKAWYCGMSYVADEDGEVVTCCCGDDDGACISCTKFAKTMTKSKRKRRI